MRRFMMCCLFVFVLFGCGNQLKEQPVSKSCTMRQEPMQMEVIAQAKDEHSNVDKVMIKMYASLQDLNLTKEDLKTKKKDLEELSQYFGKTLVEQLGSSKGIDVICNEFNEQGYQLELSMDIKVLMATLGTELSSDEFLLTEFVDYMSQMGMNCR